MGRGTRHRRLQPHRCRHQRAAQAPRGAARFPEPRRIRRRRSYGEVKSAFDAIVNRARAEKVWSSRVTFAHPKIGWVRGTGLMVGNDPLVAVVERHGIRTYSTAQIAAKLLDLCTAESREQALKAPLDVDLTRWPRSEPIDIKACVRRPWPTPRRKLLRPLSGNGWLRRRKSTDCPTPRVAAIKRCPHRSSPSRLRST